MKRRQFNYGVTKVRTLVSGDQDIWSKGHSYTKCEAFCEHYTNPRSQFNISCNPSFELINLRLQMCKRLRGATCHEKGAFLTVQAILTPLLKKRISTKTSLCGLL